MYLLDELVPPEVLKMGVEERMLADAADVDDAGVSDVAEAIDDADATAELRLADVGDRAWEVFSAAPALFWRIPNPPVKSVTPQHPPPSSSSSEAPQQKLGVKDPVVSGHG